MDSMPCLTYPGDRVLSSVVKQDHWISWLRVRDEEVKEK